MRSRVLCNTIRNCISIAVLTALGTLAIAAGPAVAAYPDACRLATQHTMARSFGLTNSTQTYSVLREPGNTAGVVHIRCTAVAWKGEKPTSAARQRDGLLAGTVATYRIETWTADSGPAAATWLANFPRKLEGLRARAKAQFLEGGLQGRPFSPQRFGLFSAIGYQAPSGALRKLRAFWWNQESGTLISINVLEAQDKPVGASLRNLASEIVPKVE